MIDKDDGLERTYISYYYYLFDQYCYLYIVTYFLLYHSTIIYLLQYFPVWTSASLICPFFYFTFDISIIIRQLVLLVFGWVSTLFYFPTISYLLSFSGLYSRLSKGFAFVVVVIQYITTCFPSLRYPWSRDLFPCCFLTFSSSFFFLTNNFLLLPVSTCAQSLFLSF